MSKPISAGHLKLEREAREGISQNSTFTIVKIFNGATTLKETIQFCQTLDFFTSRKIQVDVLENNVPFGVQTMCVMIETTTNRFRQSEGHSRRRSLLLLLLDLLLAALVQARAARRDEADLSGNGRNWRPRVAESLGTLAGAPRHL